MEMISANESLDDATELAEGGFLASLGVYHEMHCLVRLALGCQLENRSHSIYSLIDSEATQTLLVQGYLLPQYHCCRGSISPGPLGYVKWLSERS